MTSGSADTKRPRGRPVRSAQQIADTRAHVAACARRLFEAEGYEAISMRRLAREAGCTSATLYKYFDSKFAILHALWSGIFEELFEGLAAAAVEHEDPVARLHAVALGYVEYWLADRERYYLVFMSRGVSQAEVDRVVDDDAVVDRFDLLIAGLAAALGPDRVTQSELRLRAELLISSLNGIAQSLVTLSGYDWASPTELVREAVRGALRPRDV